MQSNTEGLQKIKQKIKEDAEKNVKQIVGEAQKEVNIINEANMKEAEAYKDKAEEKLKLDVKLFINKTLAQARLKSRRACLEKREKLMTGIIEEVLAKFNRNSKEYKQYMEKIIAEDLNCLAGDVTMFYNKKDLNLVKSLAGRAKENPENPQIKNIKIKESQLIGGLILEDSEGKRINKSIDSKFDRTKQKIRQGVIKILK